MIQDQVQKDSIRAHLWTASQLDNKVLAYMSSSEGLVVPHRSWTHKNAQELVCLQLKDTVDRHYKLRRCFQNCSLFSSNSENVVRK